MLQTLLEASVQALDLEFVGLALDRARDGSRAPPLCVLSTRRAQGDLARVVEELAATPVAQRPQSVLDPANGERIRIHTFRLESPGGHGTALVGSLRHDFPNELEGLFLRVLKVEASFAMERSRAAKHLQLLRKARLRVYELSRWMAKARIDLNAFRLDRFSSRVASRSDALRLAAVEQASGTGSFVWNTATGEWSASDQLCRILGVRPDATLHTAYRLLSAVYPEDRPAIEAAFAAAADGGNEFDGTFRLVRADGALAVVHCSLRRTPYRHELLGAVADISERQRTEAALEQTSAELARLNRVLTMGELTASIAHEVAQPLTALVANANACLRWLGAKPPNLHEANGSLQRVVSEGNRASQVITRLRSLLAGAALRREPLPPRALLRDVIAFLETDARARDVTLVAPVEGELPAAFGDRIQLQQVVLNLAMNALEAMSGSTSDPRTLEFNAELYRSSEVRVSIRDSGPGLAPTAREHLFEPFFSTKPDGMGMGLAISRSIVEAHGGQLWVTPNANDDAGATFQFTLPLA